jgi:hypothetical protein
VDQNVQFVITVGTVIGVFLWLRHDINLLNAKIDRVYDDLNAKIERQNDNIAALRESLGWIRGRMGFTEQSPPGAE